MQRLVHLDVQVDYSTLRVVHCLASGGQYAAPVHCLGDQGLVVEVAFEMALAEGQFGRNAGNMDVALQDPQVAVPDKIRWCRLLWFDYCHQFPPQNLI